MVLLQTVSPPENLIENQCIVAGGKSKSRKSRPRKRR